MSRPRRINPTWVAQAQKLVATATDVHQLRAAQAVLLPALFGASLEKTAALLGVGRATVHRLQAQFGTQISAKPIPRKSWGGRRHALLSVAEEKKFVSNWQAKAEAGELVVLSTMRADLAKQLGRKVAPGVVGGPVKTGASAQANGAIVFSGRGPLWPDGPISPMLGSQAAAPQSLQWLRTGIYLCVWIGQSAGRATGLVPQFEDEHHGDESVSEPSKCCACRGIHSHDCRRSQFAQKQGPGDTGESALNPFAGLLPGTEPAGACLG